jgi:pimeloyl-ACP methyl ester carboxylesterase
MILDPIRLARNGLGVLALAGLVACGGGEDGGHTEAARPQALTAPSVASVIGRGELKSAVRLNTIGVTELADVLATAPSLGLQARYSVATYRLTYVTIDGQGRELVASALAAVPQKAAGRRSPVMSWQHGTLFENSRVPSNNANAMEPAVLMASLGAIVVAADYVGYGASQGTPHPYLEAAPTAAAVVDLLTAAKTWRETRGILDNGQLFMAGYSEGGYATMAALRAMEQTASPHLADLVGVSPGAGPYSVTATMDGLLELVRERNDLLRLLAWPGLLKNLSASTRALLRDLLLHEAIPGDADVTFTSTFIDLYLADDSAGLDALSNVHDWKPTFPVLLHHGRDDRTVAHSVATRTLASLRARGSTSVSLTECDAVPAGHLECVLPYFSFMLSAAGSVARDL